MYNFTVTSDKFLLQLAEMIGVKINQIKTKDNFVGKAKDGYYIINLDDSEGPGTHWTVMRITPKFCIYFDSFGLPAPQDIIKYARKRIIVYNNDQVQDIMSDACGYYCLDFIKFFDKYKNKDLDTTLKIGHKMNKFLLPYDVNDRKDNEKILSERIKNILP